jgi:hypothetical protein
LNILFTVPAMTSSMVSEGSQRTERAWGSTLFGKPISESSRLIPESIMSSISSCVGAYSVTAGYARERRLAVLSSLGPRVATRAGAHVCLERSGPPPAALAANRYRYRCKYRCRCRCLHLSTRRSVRSRVGQ